MRIVKSLKIPLLIIVFIFVFFFVGFGIRIYQNRYRECDPSELLPTLEWIFDVNFPEDITEVKAAKTFDIDRSILFVVKFSAKPDKIEIFIENTYKLRPQPYKRGHTFMTQGYLSPGWARKRIKKGSYYTLKSLRGEVTTNGHVYIDTTNEENLVVYFEGQYPTSSEGVLADK